MEKITFTAPDTGETVEFIVLEETIVSGKSYLLVTEDEGEEAEAYILRKSSDVSEDISEYEFVTNDEELSSIGKIFEELLEDIDFIAHE